MIYEFDELDVEHNGKKFSVYGFMTVDEVDAVNGYGYWNSDIELSNVVITSVLNEDGEDLEMMDDEWKSVIEKEFYRYGEFYDKINATFEEWVKE